jgi:FlaA1/EpsC-like NDP-sugar epimerase
MWAGSALTLILMIVLASIVLFSVVYSFLKRAATGDLWAWLGYLSVFCVVGSAVYFLWWAYDSFNESVNIVHAGSILSFIGALVVMFSSTTGERVKI